MTINPTDLTIIFKILLSALLSGMIGYEREHWHKPGGIRTYMLVGVGTTLFCIVSVEILNQFPDRIAMDPTRIAAAVIQGLGFIGAGMIIHKGKRAIGLTTAAGIWVTAAVGMSIAYGYYFYSVFTACLVFFSLVIIGSFSKKNKINNQQQQQLQKQQRANQNKELQKDAKSVV